MAVGQDSDSSSNETINNDNKGDGNKGQASGAQPASPSSSRASLTSSHNHPDEETERPTARHKDATTTGNGNDKTAKDSSDCIAEKKIARFRDASEKEDADPAATGQSSGKVTRIPSLPKKQSTSGPGRGGKAARHSSTNEHYHKPQAPHGLGRFSRRSRKSASSSLQAYAGWEEPSTRRPYHQYVHELVEAGWANLADLDRYMAADIEDQELVVSAVDITDDMQVRRWDDMHDEEVLREFLRTRRKAGARVRLYMAEQRGNLASSVMEAFGSELGLDPRFFQWSIHGGKNVFTPSQRHRAPFVNIGFGVLDLSRPGCRTDAEKFQVLVYVLPDSGDGGGGGGGGWTGIVLFSSHTRVRMDPRILVPPPRFGERVPPPSDRRAASGSGGGEQSRSFREMYLETLQYLEPRWVAASPFYAIHYLLRLNYICWNQVITAIRDEDLRRGEISDTTVGHAEEIRKSFSLVQRGGSLDWKGRDEACTKDMQLGLQEDFQHLTEQTELLWQTREKMSTIRRRDSDARWAALTNSFTYIFAPVTIITGVYGMNVVEITGQKGNPGIWEFFVAVIALNAIMLVALASYSWCERHFKKEKTPSLKEAMGFAVGRTR